MRAGSGCFVIAEAGVNHNGSLELAERLVDEAHRVGADAIKFQSFRAEKIATRTASKARYQTRQTEEGETHFQMLKRLELDEPGHERLVGHCRERKIAFLSSPFDEESADLLERVGVSAFKIPSGEITNLPLLRHVARKHRPIILSTGMSTLGEVERALGVIREIGEEPVTVLHCVSQYPAPLDQVNLRSMVTMRRAFGVPVGYSDHTEGIEMAIAAVALGAVVIEKHFTLSREMEGPDHRASLEPAELEAMVRAIRNVESGLGDGIKRPAPCELENLAVSRKSVVASRTIDKGDRLTEANVTVKRPGHGIQPPDLPKVLGHRAGVDIAADEVITWEMLE